MKRRALLAGVLVSFAAGAAAQLGGGGFPGGGGRRGSRGGRNGGEDGKKGAPMERPRVNSLEITLEEFHEDLKLTPQQEPAWQAYADSVRALASDQARHARPKASDAEPPPLLQRIDRLVDSARNRFAALEEIGDRAKVLYGSLSAEQKAMCEPRLANIVIQAAGS